MKPTHLLAGLFATAVLMAGSSVHAAATMQSEPADLIVTNGHVITVDADDTIAGAVAIRGQRIVAVGSDAEIMAYRGPRTEVLDVGGRTVLPGFIDAHTHIEGMARVETFSVNIQVPPLAGPDAIVEVLVERARELPAGTWIWGQGTYNQVMPTREQLDAALPDHPVRLDWSAHDHLINHRAARIMGMDASYPDPDGMGLLDRTADGEVMIIRDAPAPWPWTSTVAGVSAETAARNFVLEGEDLTEGVRTILQDFFLEKGVTTVFDHATPAGTTAYQFLRDAGRLPLRVQMTPMVRGANQTDILYSGARTGFGDDWLGYGHLKLLIDGVWGTTAYVYEPHWEGSGTTYVPHNHGGTNWAQEDLNAVVLRAHRDGWRVQVHANGDRAQDMVLDAFEAALNEVPREDPRFRIEHFAHFLTLDHERTDRRLQRMIDLGVIPSMQVAFLWRLTDVNVQEPDVQFFPLRRLIDMGMRPPGGVDTVGTQNFATSPFFSISRAVLRDTKYGTVVQPEQAISVMEGIRMFTTWAAQAGGIEDTRGSLEPGKLADLIVLSDNPLALPPADLERIEVELVVLDGQLVHQR